MCMGRSFRNCWRRAGARQETHSLQRLRRRVIRFRRRSQTFEVQTDVRYNIRAALTLPVCFMVLSTVVTVGGSIVVKLVVYGFWVIFLGIPACLLHIAVKPVVRIDGDELVVVLGGGTGRHECRRPISECRIREVGPGEYSVVFFPWWMDVVPMGMTPSRMRIVPKERDRERWSQIAGPNETPAPV